MPYIIISQYENAVGSLSKTIFLADPRAPGSLGFTQINKHTHAPTKK